MSQGKRKKKCTKVWYVTAKIIDTAVPAPVRYSPIPETLAVQ
jgi:hypothetical protein